MMQDRETLDERLSRLKQRLREGDIQLDESLKEAMDNVRHDDHGNVDAGSVDGSLRAFLNFLDALEINARLRSTPLLNVQRDYFDLLEEYFGGLYRAMIKKHGNPQTVAGTLTLHEDMVTSFIQHQDEFIDAITGFWRERAPIVYAHLRDSKQLKGVFGGDVFPSYTQNIATGVGLYLDTIVLPDPLLRGRQFLVTLQPKMALFLIIKHALNTLGYKDLVFAQVDTPIVVIAPYLSALNSGVIETLCDEAEGDLVQHFSKMFDVAFTDMNEVKEFVSRIPDDASLAKAIADDARVLFDMDWKDPLEIQIAKNRKTTLDTSSTDGLDDNSLFLLSFFGRMLQTNDLLFQSIQIGGSPLVDVPTSWQYLLWKYEYDHSATGSGAIADQETSMIGALAVDGNPAMNLLSNLSIEALVELRQKNALQDLREIITAGITDIELADTNDLQQRFEKVCENIERALKNHIEQIEELSQKRKKYLGFDISKMIAIASLVIAAPITRNIYLGGGAGLAALFSRNPADVVTDGKLILSEGKRLKRSPAGILYKHMKN